MREVVDIPAKLTLPERSVLLKAIGVGEKTVPSTKVNELIEKALDMYSEYAEPAGIYSKISADDFGIVYPGEGKNEPETPLGLIYPQSDALALFAVTLGEAVSDTITSLFNSNDGAAGYTLDALASEAAENAADYLQRSYYDSIIGSGITGPDSAIMRYSPGYCGWDISGQRKLFEYLEPVKIGITLNDSCLMRPLKSVSGVFVVGNAEIHRFIPEYPFCGQCRTRSCLERIRSLK